MAYAVQVEEYAGRQSGLFPQLPPKKVKRYGAAGLTDQLDAETRTVTLRNYGDVSGFFRLNADGDTTQAAGADTKSYLLAPGDVFTFTLQPGWQSASTFKIDLR